VLPEVEIDLGLEGPLLCWVSPNLVAPESFIEDPILTLRLVPGGFFRSKGTENGQQLLTLNVQKKKIKLTNLFVQAQSMDRTIVISWGLLASQPSHSHGLSLILLVCTTTQPHEVSKALLIDWYSGPALADISWSKNHPVLGRQGVSGSLRQFPACNVKRGFPYTWHGHLTAHTHIWHL
jgi:hypothetical protein